jgi:prepilin-type N-terminal cleavage/methylation domain-containing protein
MDSLTRAVPHAPTFAGVVPPARFVAQRGFTLTEMAVVLVIVALLIGGMILPLAAQQELRNVAEAQKLLADVSEALYGYAASHKASDSKPYLPCPDTDGDGRENRTGNACTLQEGTLPWADLGLGRRDAWSNPLRYRVTAVFSNNASGFTLLSNGDLRICENAACTTVIATAVPVVILSPGKNGGGTPANADELENTDLDSDFVQRTHVDGGYDDVLAWLPASILLNRMISAGQQF